MFSFGTPTLWLYSALIACCTMSSGMTFHASLAVAFALCAPSICAMLPHAMSCLLSAASTNERTMLMLR